MTATANPAERMSLDQALESYFATRRALGNELLEAERITRRFTEWIEADERDGFTAAQAVAWARGDGTWKNSYQCQRLSAVRSFARYCLAAGLPVGVPAANALRAARDRRHPHIYAQAEVDALVAACPRVFAHPLISATMATIINLLAVTGMRVCEALRLVPADIDARDATINIAASKHGPERMIPIHPSTVNALTTYQAMPERRLAAAPVSVLFVSTRGGPYRRGTVEGHFQRIRQEASTWCPNVAEVTLKDLRHSFATRQMIRAYTDPGRDPVVTLGQLAIWLGHSDPKHTYWYVEAVPQLLALAARRRDGEPGQAVAS